MSTHAAVTSPLTVQTDRLLLRQFEESDIESFARIYGDSEVMRYMGNGVKSPAEAAKSIYRKMSHWTDHGYGLWCVVESASNRVIGHAGLGFLSPLQRTEVAYLIDRPFWGRGYATEATRASIEYGFKYLLLPEIIAIAPEHNEASLRVMKKCGMQPAPDVLVWGKTFRCYTIARTST